MCICSVHEVWYWFILALVLAITLLAVYINHKDRETDRYIASLELENDRLENAVYDLENKAEDLAEKLKAERIRLNATINLLTKR